jgi:hypothetical protein
LIGQAVLAAIGLGAAFEIHEHEDKALCERKGGKSYMSRGEAAGSVSTRLVISRCGTFSRRERHAFNCIIPVAASFPSFKTVDEAGEALYGRLTMKPLRACFATSGRIFRFNKVLRRLLAGVTDQ